jgi:hypothetical protein
MKFILIFLLLLVPSLCDLPVHCLAKDIEGLWSFFVSKPFPLDSEASEYRCGHGQPDRNTDHIFRNFKSEFPLSQDDKFLMELRLPNIAFNQNNEKMGTWTMIYDEGWELRLSNSIFLAFSYYVKEGAGEPRDDDDEQTKGYFSYCNRTFLGWFTRGKERGCFYAEKIGEETRGNTNIINEEKMENYMANDVINQLDREETINRKIVERSMKNLQTLQPKPEENQFQMERSIEKEGSNPAASEETRKKMERSVNNGELFQPRFQENVKTMERSVDNEETEDGSEVIKRFKDKLREYGLPNEDLLNEDRKGDDFFQFDYNFIEMVNEFRESSLWEAKAHDDFKNKTAKQMKNLIGLTPFKEFKFLNVKNLKDQNLVKDEEIPTSFLELKTKQRLFAKKNSLFFKSKGETSIFSTEDEQSHPINEPSSLPANFDWRNINNSNFDPPVEHQGFFFPPLAL